MEAMMVKKSDKKKSDVGAMQAPVPATEAATLSLVKQLDIFDPRPFADDRIDIIGVGAVGSHVAWFLSKTGFKNIHIWDHDEIVAHNISNQLFFLDQVGQKKVDALAANILRGAGVTVVAHAEKYLGQVPLGKHVFLGVDSMDMRRLIWEKAIKMKFNVETMFETRIGSALCRVYLVSPISLAHIKGWEASLCRSDEVHEKVSLCGAVPGIVTTSALAADVACWQFIKWLETRDVENEVVLAMKAEFSLLTRKFI